MTTILDGKLTAKAKRLLMYGCGEERFEIVFEKEGSRSKRKWEMDVQWRGLCGQIEAWYHGKDPEQTAERFGAVTDDLRQNGPVSILTRFPSCAPQLE